MVDRDGDLGRDRRPIRSVGPLFGFPFWLEDETMGDSYYKTIDGEKYDRKILDYAEQITGGGSRLGRNDAQRIFEMVADAGTYTDVEKRTIKRLRSEYEWTTTAREWFQAAVRRWSATQ